MKKNYNCGKNNSHYKHGMKGTRFYNIWKGMKVRCYNKNRMYYKNYGGRGIIVCEKWKDSFMAFYKDMYIDYISHRYDHGEKNTTLDRINNDGNYCKKNCRWATRDKQMENSRMAYKIIFNKKVYTLSSLSKKYNINLSTLSRRLKRGIKIEEALICK
jgi:hypothetical protein